MSDLIPEEVVSPYPVAVDLSIGTVEILAPEGEPSGDRLRLPDGRVTALNNDGGTLNAIPEADLLAIEAAEAEIPFLE